MTIFVLPSTPFSTTSTAGDIIKAALEELRVYAPGQQLSSADSSRALNELNKLLDSLSNESLACYAPAETTFTLVPGKTQYTIGTTGTPDISATRPLRLREGRGVAYTTDFNSNNYPLDVVPLTQWNQLGNRSATTQSDIPTLLYYDPQFPLGVVNIYPTPIMGYTTTFTSWAPLAIMTSLTQTLSLPPGYELMIQLELEKRLWRFFKSGPVDPSLVQDARIAKRNVKRTNQRDDWAELDNALRGGPGYYNVYTDGYRPG